MELPKDNDGGVGLTIVGGDHTGSLDLGIFVKSVTPDGPADRDGRIHPGDRVIAINGQSLEGMPHHVAVDLMRKYVVVGSVCSECGGEVQRCL